MNQLITIKQLSEKIGFAVPTIYKWVDKRTIPYLKVNGNIRFDEQKIENWLRLKEVRTKATI